MQVLAQVVYDSVIDYYPVTVSPETSVLDVVAVLAKKRSSYVLVVDYCPKNIMRVLGWFTEHDVVKLLSSGFDFAAAKISQVMITSVIALKQSEIENITKLVSLLDQHMLPLVPIVDECNQLVGAITLQNIYQAMLIFSCFSEEQKSSKTIFPDKSSCYGLGELQRLAEVLPVGIFRVDTLGNCLYVNRHWCEITGMTPEQAMGRGWQSALYPEDKESLFQSWYQSANKNLAFCSEYRFQRPDGSVSWVISQAVAEQSNTGEIIAYISTVTEIRDRKSTEAALIQSEERFRNLIETTSDLIWEVDENAVYTYVSSKVEDMLGYKSEEVVGKLPLELMPQQMRESIAEIFVAIVAKQQPLECMENIHLHKDGHPVLLETSGVPIFDLEGRFCGYRGISRDVTQRKRSENALREVQEQLQAILDNSSAIIYVIDAQNRVLLINCQYEKVFQISKEQIIGNSIYDFLPRETADQFALNNHKVFTSGEPLKVEEVVFHNDEEHTYLSVKFPLKDANNHYYAICSISTDITDRKQAEASLLRFRKAIESSSDAIGMIDVNGEAIYVNPAFVELFEYNLLELQAAGSLAVLYLHPSDWRKIFTTVEKGQSWRGEVKMQTRCGRILYIDIRADAIKNANDHPISIVIIYTDVTERKEAEASLILRDRAIAASSNGIVISDARLPNLPVIYANPAFKDITGYSPEEVIGRNCRFLQGADINQPGINKLRHAISQDKSCTVILRNYRKDGSLFWNELNISPVFDAEGNCTHYVGIQNDITKYKQAEMALLVSQKRLQYLLSSTPAVIYTYKPWEKSGPTFMSDNITAMMGYEPREFMQDYQFSINHIHPEDVAGALEAEFNILNEGKYICEYRFLHKDGTYRWVHDEGKLMRDESGNPLELVGYWADITKHKHLEEELRTALEKEKELNELKSRFVTMTSHEFRTPLSTILSSSELLEHYHHKWPEEKKLSHFHRIQAAVKHMTEMLNDVLVIGKAEAGKLDFKPTPLDLVEYCRHLLEELQLDANHQSAIAFNCEYESIPCCMDDKLLGYILRNLLSNARKYSQNANPVKFNLTCWEEKAVFKIQDQGIGIPPEDLPHLFESFHRATNVGNIQGTGLGLAIVKKCIDIHKGEIKVISELELGTTFTIILPLKNR